MKIKRQLLFPFKFSKKGPEVNFSVKFKHFAVNALNFLTGDDRLSKASTNYDQGVKLIDSLTSTQDFQESFCSGRLREAKKTRIPHPTNDIFIFWVVYPDKDYSDHYFLQILSLWFSNKDLL